MVFWLFVCFICCLVNVFLFDIEKVIKELSDKFYYVVIFVYDVFDVFLFFVLFIYFCGYMVNMLFIFDFS